MDFTFSDDQQAIADLAARILGDKVTHASLRRSSSVGATAGRPSGSRPTPGRPWPRPTCWAWPCPRRWAAAATACSEQPWCSPRSAAPRRRCPYLASIVVMGAMTIADFGTEAQQADAAAGRDRRHPVFLTAALVEPGVGPGPDVPATTATPDGDAGLAPRRREAVRALAVAAARSVGLAGRRAGAGARPPPRTARSSWRWSTPGRRRHRVDLDVTVGWPEADLRLDGVWCRRRRARRRRARDRPGDGRPGHGRGVRHPGRGVGDAALRLTATYTTERHQFGSPIATFQAVAQRAADAYIDTQGIQLHRLAGGLAPRRGPARGRRARHRQVLGRRGRQPGGRGRPAPPRWHRRRHRLPAAPLLPAGQAPRADPRRQHRAAAPPRRPDGGVMSGLPIAPPRRAVVTGSASGIGAAVRPPAGGRRLARSSASTWPARRSRPTCPTRRAGPGPSTACSIAGRARGALDAVVACAGLGPQIPSRHPLVSVNYFGAIAVLDGLLALLAAGSAPAARGHLLELDLGHADARPAPGRADGGRRTRARRWSWPPSWTAPPSTP